MKRILPLLSCVAILVSAGSARADSASELAPPAKDAPAGATGVDPPAAPPAAEPYVSPFQLRGVSPGTSVRLDSTVAPFTDPKTSTGQVETVSFLAGSVRVAKEWALNARVGFVRNDLRTVDGGSDSASGATNATVGGMYGTSLGQYLRLSASAGVGLPIGAGGGNAPDADRAAAMKAAAFARASMDNTMFAVNDLGFPVGLDLAYTRRGFTGQAEISLIPSVRVKGEQKSPDAGKVNATSGLFFGYFVVPRHLSVGVEGHYQRYLSTPDAVAKDPSQRDNLTAGGGVRAYFELAENVSFRPGLSYGAGLAGAVADRGYQMLGVDLPVVF